MNFLKKAITIGVITIVAIADVKIIVDYEIIRPTGKYSIVDQRKTVAEVIDFSKVHPEEAIEIETLEETSEETTEENVETIEENNTVTEKIADATASDEANFEALSNALSNNAVIEDVAVYQLIEPVPEATPEPEPEPTPESSVSSDIIETAKDYLGYSYVSGGSSPETGFDCSGFTKYIYGLYGINLNRVAADQADNGTPISKEELQPGDLVLFSYYGSDSIGHSGIYIGDGNFIHAANSNRGVVIDTLESGYYLDNYVTARRF